MTQPTTARPAPVDRRSRPTSLAERLVYDYAGVVPAGAVIACIFRTRENLRRIGVQDEHQLALQTLVRLQLTNDYELPAGPAREAAARLLATLSREILEAVLLIGLAHDAVAVTDHLDGPSLLRRPDDPPTNELAPTYVTGPPPMPGAACQHHRPVIPTSLPGEYLG